MDDLEKAILLVYDPSSAASSSHSLRSAALAYLDCLKSDSPSSLLPLLLDRLLHSTLIPVQFWSLQSLNSLLHFHYPSLPQSHLPHLRSSLLSLFSSNPLPLSSPPFLKNKLSQVLSFLIRLEYPSLFPHPFLSLLPPASPASADMLARLLAALDDDLISQDYPRSADDAAAAARVKDAMRVQCVPQIVRYCFDTVSMYRSSDPALAAGVLDTMRRYISWIDIGLVANEAFLPLLFDLILSPVSPEVLKSASAGCLLAVVSKRMDPQSKVQLLRNLQLGRVFADPELVRKIGTLITGYATEVLDCYKRLGSDNADGSLMELLEEALPSVFYVMQNSEEVESSNDGVGFLSDYVSTMKSPSPKQVVYLGQILELIKMQISYDPTYRKNLELPDKIGKEEEDQMAEQRKDLFTLFRAVCRVAPEVSQTFIRNFLAASLASQEMNVEEVEAMLSLLYQLGETVSEEQMKRGSGLLAELVPMLLSARFFCHSHRIVALVYLETVTRYMKFVQENNQYITGVLTVFLDERGIHHPNSNVGRRASYLFMRAVKLLKSKLVPYIDTILQNLQATVARYTSMDWSKCSGSEDGSHTFEAIGLLIGTEDVSPEKQSEYLAALLNPLCQQVELLLLEAKAQGLEESSVKVVIFQQIIMAINALSKGFSERLVTASRPAIGSMFKQTLDVLLQVLVAFPNIKPLRNKITSFLHRMVEILGASVFPYLPMAFNQLLLESEPKDMVDFVVLINQVICKFSTSAGSILEEIFPTIASRLFVILSTDAFPSGPSYNTEEIRELQELQRTLYTFLHVMATHDLSSVFLSPNSRVYLDAIMQLLLLTSCSHKDILIRKMCIQIFVRLVKDWCAKYNGEDKVPGFRSFIIEKFATNCCLYSVLEKTFEFCDANTIVLFGEIVMAQKVMYEKFGDEFLFHFVSKGLSKAQCPQDLAEQYYQKLQANDVKAFKSFYQTLVEKLRQQQNGSLVFR